MSYAKPSVFMQNTHRFFTIFWTGSWHTGWRTLRPSLVFLRCQPRVCAKTVLKVYFHLTKWNTDVHFFWRGYTVYIQKHEYERKLTILTIPTRSNRHTSARCEHYQRDRLYRTGLPYSASGKLRLDTSRLRKRNICRFVFELRAHTGRTEEQTDGRTDRQDL